MSTQIALEYLRAEGFEGNIRLKEMARFDESRLGGGEGIVYSFDDPRTDEAHYVITGMLVNYYPEWGLNPEEIYEQHLGARHDPGACDPEQRQKYAPRIEKLLAGHGLSPAGCQVLEVWKVPSPRRRDRSALAALVRVPARGSLTLFVDHDTPMECTQKLWQDRPLPTYVHLRRYLGRRVQNEPPEPTPTPAESEPGTYEPIDPLPIGFLGAILGGMIGASTRRTLTPFEIVAFTALLFIVVVLGDLWDQYRKGWKGWLQAVRAGVLWAILIVPTVWLVLLVLGLPAMAWVVGWKGAIFGVVVGSIVGGVGGFVAARVQRWWRSDAIPVHADDD